MDSNSPALSQLQDLLSINIDSQKGFLEAADSTSDPQLKTFFAEFSQKRAHNAAELRSFISSAGEQPTSTGSMSAAIHRWWIDAKQALTGKDAKSILSEAERGEDSIKKVYENALTAVGNSNARDLVERQYRNIREGHDKVKAMRDTYRRNPHD
ncbi:MAG: PA2169 family four-helix-bundle protein [Phycisphaerae bacterium]